MLNSIELVSVSIELTEECVQLGIDIVGNGAPLTEDTHLHKEGPHGETGYCRRCQTETNAVRPTPPGTRSSA